MVSAAGAELVALNNILAIDGSNDTVRTLSNSAQNRINALGSTPSTSPLGSRVGTDLKSGNDQYNSLTDTTVTEFGDTVTAESNAARTAALRDTAIVLGAVLLALAIALVISRSLIDPIRRLRFAALQAARRGLPDAIERIRAGASIDDVDFARVPIRTHEEIGELARAVDDMHGQAITLAGEQATLRRQVNDMFETLSRRNKSLVDQQLGLIEQLEQDEDDPRRLENLFRLDHIAARMRRNGDNLLVLAGTDVRRARTAPVALGDILRAAVSGVEEYRRVELGQIPPGVVTGHAAPDVVHLIAELLDNSLRYSPPETTVSINAARTIDGSMIVEIADLGIGMSPADILDANERLAAGGEMSADTARRMGLFVVSRISRRYNISVRLRPTATSSTHSGITATVLLPTSILDSSRGPEIRTPRTGPVPTLDRTPPPAPSEPSWSKPVPTELAPPQPATRSFADLPRRTPSNSTDRTETFARSHRNPFPRQQRLRGYHVALRAQVEYRRSVPRLRPLLHPPPRCRPSLLCPIPKHKRIDVPSRAYSFAGIHLVGTGPEIPVGPHPSTTPPPRHRLSPPTPTNTAAFFSSRTRDGSLLAHRRALTARETATRTAYSLSRPRCRFSPGWCPSGSWTRRRRLQLLPPAVRGPPTRIKAGWPLGPRSRCRSPRSPIPDFPFETAEPAWFPVPSGEAERHSAMHPIRRTSNVVGAVTNPEYNEGVGALPTISRWRTVFRIVHDVAQR